MARLKVFSWSDGFHAFTVAASSRPKALAAWGVGQDLFKTGLAHELDQGPDHDRALADPGRVIERGLAIDPGAVAPARTRKAPSAARTQAARARVDALQADLSDLDARHAEAAQALEDEAQALARRRDALEKRHKIQRADLVRRLKDARGKL